MDTLFRLPNIYFAITPIPILPNLDNSRFLRIRYIVRRAPNSLAAEICIKCIKYALMDRGLTVVP